MDPPPYQSSNTPPSSDPPAQPEPPPPPPQGALPSILHDNDAGMGPPSFPPTGPPPPPPASYPNQPPAPAHAGTAIGASSLSSSAYPHHQQQQKLHSQEQPTPQDSMEVDVDETTPRATTHSFHPAVVVQPPPHRPPQQHPPLPVVSTTAAASAAHLGEGTVQAPHRSVIGGGVGLGIGMEDTATASATAAREQQSMFRPQQQQQQQQQYQHHSTLVGSSSPAAAAAPVSLLPPTTHAVSSSSTTSHGNSIDSNTTTDIGVLDKKDPFPASNSNNISGGTDGRSAYGHAVALAAPAPFSFHNHPTNLAATKMTEDTATTTTTAAAAEEEERADSAAAARPTTLARSGNPGVVGSVGREEGNNSATPAATLDPTANAPHPSTTAADVAAGSRHSFGGSSSSQILPLLRPPALEPGGSLYGASDNSNNNSNSNNSNYSSSPRNPESAATASSQQQQNATIENPASSLFGGSSSSTLHHHNHNSKAAAAAATKTGDDAFDSKVEHSYPSGQEGSYQQQQQQHSTMALDNRGDTAAMGSPLAPLPRHPHYQGAMAQSAASPSSSPGVVGWPAGKNGPPSRLGEGPFSGGGGILPASAAVDESPRVSPSSNNPASLSIAAGIQLAAQQQQQQQPVSARSTVDGDMNYHTGFLREPPRTLSPQSEQQQSTGRSIFTTNSSNEEIKTLEDVVAFGGGMRGGEGGAASATAIVTEHMHRGGGSTEQQHSGLPPLQSLLHGSQQQQNHQQSPSQNNIDSNKNRNNNLADQQPPQGVQLGGGLFGNPLGGTPGGMRELRVEDALLYLDDVKREFKDRPAIYNEFLAIMKNFKSQEVDTPGVINRVSKLFRGYNNLILGFNTFLPDGYKISLADLERAEALRAAEEQAAALQAQGSPSAKRPKGLPLAAGGANRALNSGPHPADDPNHSKNTSGMVPVIGVKTPGYRNARPLNPTQGGAIKQHEGGTWGRTPSEGNSPQGVHYVNQPQQNQEPILQAPRGLLNPASQQQQQPIPPPPPPQHQAVEFDHAISYVTTIKKRFASDPNTYHSFLEILHTYQKEQRGIKEVLEQVAHLFQDHPDLLKEFTFFLPDAVQEQAKERLHRAAAESESRILAQRQQADRLFQGMGNDQQKLVDMTKNRQMGLAEGDPRGKKRQSDGQSIPKPPTQPEAYVYNSAVERQFFDSAREALTSYSRDSGQAWAEFLKCLDMYAQEILSRSEMLSFVETLLGKRNNFLFEEFKRILSAAGSPTLATQLIEDAWYSVPLAEIDFSRCRRCSPSYRALPRDYPAHPCSERSEEEATVLNDVWVSLPVGSEESYTFRHMRRNTYEETLFRVEDERFEIDMSIDSNATTLKRLEPIAEEIALLSQEDYVPLDLGLKLPVETTGLGGKRFQYSFDKNLLSVIHRNTITRIYGDNGQEMLDLLVRNPTVAVPLVVQRLRQKDSEWRAVRDRLNRQWKELAENNYYKSLDHRSLTWRTTDKRAISTRTLIAEIKDRAANGGRESKEAYRQKLDKAKEEHGSFVEVTVGEKLTQDVDLTFLPKPDRRLFTPHLTLNYKNVSWAQRDAYRLLAFALERGPISPADKERCHRLWVEFLGPWFDLSFNWMQKPAVSYQESSTTLTRTIRTPPVSIVSEDDEESLDEDSELASHMVTEELRADNKDKEFTDHHPLPAGAHVSTLYGEGKIVEFRRIDHIYAVRLGFGAIGYLRPATVLCSMLPVEKSAYTRQLRAEDRTKLARPNDQLAFGTQSLYLFFRLHEILIRRLNMAKQLAYSVGDDPSLQSMVEQMPNVNPKAVGRRRYEAYLSLVYALLDGGVGAAAEGGKYEDRVRSLLGHGAFELATMDKLIAHIWKDIQIMANDETMWSLVQLYRRHMLAGSFQPEAFRQEAAYLSDGEPMYTFQHCPVFSRDESMLYVEYLGIMDDEDDDENNMEEEIEPVVEPVNPNRRPKRKE